MLFLIVFIASGMILGLTIRKIADVFKTSERVLTTLYYPCLFFLGIFLHLDGKLVTNIDKIGWNTFSNIVIGFSVIIISTWSVIKLFKLILKLIKTKHCF